MEIIPIIAPLADGVKGGIGEVDGHPVRLALLVGQGHEAGPKGRRRAGAHHRVIGIIGVAGVALVRRDEVVVRVHGHVGNVALDGRAPVGGHVQALLIAGNGNQGTNAPASRVGGAAQRRVPSGFGFIGPALHRQLRAPHHRHLDGVVEVDGRRNCGRGVAGHVGPVVPCGLEEGLPLGRELLEGDRGGGVPESRPGTTDLRSLVVSGDLVQEQVRGGVGGAVWRLINQNLRQARRHIDGHLDVQGALDDAVGVGGGKCKPVHRHVGEGDVGQAREALVARDVGGVVTLELHQRHRLPAARQADAGNISITEVITPEKPAGGRARSRRGRGGGRVA